MTRPLQDFSVEQAKKSAMLQLIANAPKNLLPEEAAVSIKTGGQTLPLQLQRYIEGMTGDAYTRIGRVVDREIKICKDPDAPDDVVEFGNMLVLVALNKNERNLGKKLAEDAEAPDEAYFSYVNGRVASTMEMKTEVVGHQEDQLDATTIEAFVKDLNTANPSQAREKRIAAALSLYSYIIKRYAKLGDLEAPLMKHLDEIQPLKPEQPEHVGDKRPADELPAEKAPTPAKTKKSRRNKN